METERNDEVAALTAELAATLQRVQALETRMAEQSGVQPRAGRRNFLMLAAAGAVAGTAASLRSPESAAAATGANMVIGHTNTPTANADETVIESPSFTELAQQLFVVRNFSGSTNLPDATWRAAIHAGSFDSDATGGHRIGVVGEVRNFADANKKGIGVLGAANHTGAVSLPSEPVGVMGYADAQGASGSGTAVKGVVFNGSSTIGVHGLTNATIGVQAEATAAGGVGLNAVAPTSAIAARVEGRLRQVTAAAAGAPAFAANAGEQWRDANGDLWICTGSGAPGTWRKVVAQHPSYASAGGSVNLLASPIRLLDTRPTGTAPQNNGGVPLAANTDLVVSIVGVAVGSVSVPSGATGIIGNLTAVSPLGNGHMTLWAENVALPGTSNLNFRTGVNIANSFTCALSPSGKVRVRASAATNVLLDVVGFLF